MARSGVRCRCGHDRHAGRWCVDDRCVGDECMPADQPIDDETGEPLPPVPVDGQRWHGDRKIAPRYDDG